LAVQTNFVVFYLETAAMKKIMGYDKGKLSREQIIEAGAGVVLAKGYAATTMANLSGAAHTSAGKLTHQFPTKGSLSRMWPCAASPRRFALADPSLWLIDHEGRHLIEEFPKDFFGFAWQRSFPQRIVHQPHPAVADSLIDGKRRMPRPEARMASLFNVSLGPPEPTDQEISEALLGPWKIICRVDWP
jgi:hypothetical protein